MTAQQQQPATGAEMAALGELGYVHLSEPSMVLDVYRAGFADGRNPPAPRVFREGDPEPGAEVAAVMDGDGDIWVRTGGPWRCSSASNSWLGILAYGPLVSCAPLDYSAAVEADNKRRAAAESGGGAW